MPTKLLLTHSEICEALEGDRKDAMDDHLPQFPAFETEMGDASSGSAIWRAQRRRRSARRAKAQAGSTTPSRARPQGREPGEEGRKKVLTTS